MKLCTLHSGFISSAGQSTCTTNFAAMIADCPHPKEQDTGLFVFKPQSSRQLPDIALTYIQIDVRNDNKSQQTSPMVISAGENDTGVKQEAPPPPYSDP